MTFATPAFTTTPFASLALDAVTQQVQNFFPHLFQLESQVHQHLGSNTLLFTQQPQENVFRPNVVMVQIPSLFH